MPLCSLSPFSPPSPFFCNSHLLVSSPASIFCVSEYTCISLPYLYSKIDFHHSLDYKLSLSLYQGQVIYEICSLGCRPSIILSIMLLGCPTLQAHWLPIQGLGNLCHVLFTHLSRWFNDNRMLPSPLFTSSPSSGALLHGPFPDRSSQSYSHIPLSAQGTLCLSQ